MHPVTIKVNGCLFFSAPKYPSLPQIRLSADLRTVHVLRIATAASSALSAGMRPAPFKWSSNALDSAMFIWHP